MHWVVAQRFPRQELCSVSNGSARIDIDRQSQARQSHPPTFQQCKEVGECLGLLSETREWDNEDPSKSTHFSGGDAWPIKALPRHPDARESRSLLQHCVDFGIGSSSRLAGCWFVSIFQGLLDILHNALKDPLWTTVQPVRIDKLIAIGE